MPDGSKLVSMKLTPKQSKAESEPTEVTRPEYPFGLRIRLHEEDLQRLGIKELPAVDLALRVAALTRVVQVSSDESSAGGAHRSVELQITDLALYKTSATKDAGETLYGK